MSRTTTELTADETAELAELTRRAMTAVRAASSAPGFNVGMNQGPGCRRGDRGSSAPARGAAMGRDTNFMPVVGHTRVLPQLLRQTRQMLAESWPAD